LGRQPDGSPSHVCWRSNSRDPAGSGPRAARFRLAPRVQTMSQTAVRCRCCDVHAGTEATMSAEAPTDSFDFEAVFHTHYRRIARVIVRVIQDPSRADELAVDVFWKLWRH